LDDLFLLFLRHENTVDRPRALAVVPQNFYEELSGHGTSFHYYEGLAALEQRDVLLSYDKLIFRMPEPGCVVCVDLQRHELLYVNACQDQKAIGRKRVDPPVGNIWQFLQVFSVLRLSTKIEHLNQWVPWTYAVIHVKPACVNDDGVIMCCFVRLFIASSLIDPTIRFDDATVVNIRCWLATCLCDARLK
jgi:hypothetical protein